MNPSNFFKQKAKIEILLREKGIYRVTMATEVDPNALHRKLNGTIGGMRHMVFCA